MDLESRRVTAGLTDAGDGFSKYSALFRNVCSSHLQKGFEIDRGHSKKKFLKFIPFSSFNFSRRMSRNFIARCVLGFIHN